MDLKELNTKSYSINSKYKKHTGPKIRYSQKSRMSIYCKDDKANRKWRVYAKREANHRKKQEIKGNMKDPDFNCCQKLAKSKLVDFSGW